MVSHKTWHGVAHDFLHVHVVAIGYLEQNLAVAGGYRTNETNGIFLVIILTQVAIKESLYLVGDQLTSILVVEVIGKEE